MSDYRDYDPEDALDATDPPAIQLDVLERVLIALRSNIQDDRTEGRRLDALRVIRRLNETRGVQRQRLRRLREDFEAL